MSKVAVRSYTISLDGYGAGPDQSREEPLGKNGESLRVTVSDRGAGVGPGRDKVFQPFYTTKKSGGTGLGLAISRDIVRRHGGEIALEPRDGGGTEARVDLPRVPEGSPS